MKVRKCFETFVVLPLPDQEARRRYENAATTWERYSGDPDIVEINAKILASYTHACQAANLMNSASTGNWRYIRASYPGRDDGRFHGTKSTFENGEHANRELKASGR
mgnify:CR=1 FL=1|jgi:hypothetical protein